MSAVGPASTLATAAVPVPAASPAAPLRSSAQGTNAGHGHDAHGEMHLPHGSWWPFWLAMGISLFGLGLILFGHELKKTLVTELAGDHYEQHFVWEQLAPWALLPLGIGLVFLLVTLVGWWREDMKWWDSNTGTGNHIPKAGTLLFIGSEIFLFGGLFATYLTYKGLAGTAGTPWPDGEHTHLPVLKTLIFSLFLFASSFTVHKAEHAIKQGDRLNFQRWWWATIFLGAIFLVGQVLEYTNLILEGETLGSSHFITAFFMLTGTHGLHVFGGLVVLTIVGVRAAKGQFTKERHVLPQCASMYWHFVDIVWVIVFSVIYLGEFWPL